MTISARQLNRATLARQLLLARAPLSVADAVRQIVGLQAQSPASPYIALWNRLLHFDARHLDAAFADRSVVKATLLRLTLHAVNAEDWSLFYTAMLPSLRASRLADRRFTSSGLTAADVDEVLPALRAFADRDRTEAELEEMIKSRLGDRAKSAWWALRRFAPLHHAPIATTWSFGTPSSFVSASMDTNEQSHEASVRYLLRRYLRAFGPASAQDFAQFTMLRRPVVQRALRDLGEDVVKIPGPGQRTLFDLAGAPIPDGDAFAPPRLLPMWDNVLLAYSDRCRVVPGEYRQLIFRRNGDVLPAVLVDGHVVGVWRPVDHGVEVAAFQRLSTSSWSGLAEQADALATFLQTRDPLPYQRYFHWWSTGLPSTDTRVLAA